MENKDFHLKIIFALVMLSFSFQFVSADFTVAVLPDTQGYSESHPEIFMAQTEWIRDNAEKEDIVAVIHEGDIVNQQINQSQWQNADRALSVLDGYVPYILSVGNHDMGSDEIEDANDRDTSTYNTYFPYTRYEKEEWYGDHMGDDNDNYYILFSADDMDFMILSLEFGPDGNILDWANAVVEEHKDRRVIVVTHSYLDEDNERMNWNSRINAHRYGIEKTGIVWYSINNKTYYADKNIENLHKELIDAMNEREGNLMHVINKIDDKPGNYIHEMWDKSKNGEDKVIYFVNGSGPLNGEEIWQYFVKKHENIFLVLSGHALEDGNGKLVSTGDNGNKVHQIVTNYQFLKNGGDGWLKLIKFMPDKNIIKASTYSPYIDQYEIHSKNYKIISTDANNQDIDKFNLKSEHDFELDYDMSNPSISKITGAVVGTESNSANGGKNMLWFWLVGILVTGFAVFYIAKEIRRKPTDSINT